MGKGKSSSAPTNQTVNQVNIPPYLKPYLVNLTKRAEAESYRPYQTYDAERIAGFTPAQEALQAETLGMQTPEQFAAATAGAGATGMLGLGTAQRGFEAAFGPTQNYMSSYVQGALDPQIRELNRQAALNQRSDALASMGRGSYGGSRSTLMAAERERIANQGIQDVLGRGYQSAFDAAQRQQQFLGGLGMQGLQQAGTASQLMGQLGTAQQEADLKRLTAQSATAGQAQALQQQQMDMAYADFLRQRDYPKEQLGFFSNIIRGLPQQMGSTQLTYQQQPSMASQIGGLGIAGLGLYNAIGRG